MADKPLKVQGVPAPKGTAWLDEVRVDAARAAVQQLKRQKEQREFEEAKANGLTPQEILEQAKQDLNPSEEVAQPEEEQVAKPLVKMNKAELLEVADAEGVDVSEATTNAELVSAIEASREGN